MRGAGRASPTRGPHGGMWAGPAARARSATDRRALLCGCGYGYAYGCGYGYAYGYGYGYGCGCGYAYGCGCDCGHERG